MEGEYSGISLDHAVARICLEHTQDQLPQWSAVYPDGRIILGRALRPVINRPVAPIARPLFTINWADSGPGISWPEAYYVTYIPGYHHYVVTASQDSPDVYGYTDEAIGYFSGNTEGVDSACGEVIRDWWTGMFSRQPWKSFDRRGTVDQPTAEAWAWQVWGGGNPSSPPALVQGTTDSRYTTMNKSIAVLKKPDQWPQGWSGPDRSGVCHPDQGTEHEPGSGKG